MKRKYKVVERTAFESDFFHAPYRMIEAESRGKAKSKYLKIYPEYLFVDIMATVVSNPTQ